MAEKSNIMEEYLRSLIKDELQSHCSQLESTLKEEEAAKIVLAILPHLDDLISKRVKQHFIELADFMKAKFQQ